MAFRFTDLGGDSVATATRFAALCTLWGMCCHGFNMDPLHIRTFSGALLCRYGRLIDSYPRDIQPVAKPPGCGPAGWILLSAARADVTPDVGMEPVS